MNELDVVLSSRVRLARNYEDLPFDLGEKPDSAAMCVARTVQALRLEENAPVYDLVRLRDLTPLQRQGLAESRQKAQAIIMAGQVYPCRGGRCASAGGGIPLHHDE